MVSSFLKVAVAQELDMRGLTYDEESPDIRVNFFINTQDNLNLNHSGESNSRAWGYAVFGRVTDGMSVVDEIRFVETTTTPPYSKVPKVPVVIESVEIIDG